MGTPKEPTIQSLSAELAEQKKASAKQMDLIQKLTAIANKNATPEAPKEKPVPKIPEKPLEVGAKKYHWAIAAFRLPGSDVVITAETANTDEEVISSILEIEGQGILIEIV